jgi:hypothetical protein
METSTGVPALDQSIQDAILSSAPFKKMPKKFPKAEAPFVMTFDYQPQPGAAANPMAAPEQAAPQPAAAPMAPSQMNSTPASELMSPGGPQPGAAPAPDAAMPPAQP